MKMRHGFVSNSSSSSFILRTEADIQVAKDNRIQYYPVNAMIERLTVIIETIKSACTENESSIFPEFFIYNKGLFGGYRDDGEYHNLLEELKPLKDCYITEPYDRDHAYENNIDLEMFEGDL